MAGCGKGLVLGGAALQRCDKNFIIISGFRRWVKDSSFSAPSQYLCSGIANIWLAQISSGWADEVSPGLTPGQQ